MTPTPHLFGSALLTLGLALGPGTLGAETLTVTSAADSGDGSLRAALATAADSLEATTVVIDTPGQRITLASPLSYASQSPLTILGNDTELLAEGNFTLLQASGTAELRIIRLDLVGPGGFDIEARGDLDGPAGKGLFLDVPEAAEGRVRLHLEEVAVSGVAGHGIHVSDCTLADACGAGEGGDGDGSAATIDVTLVDVTITDVGLGSFDADGLRVDERGPGDILFTALFLDVSGVGADGVELDEGQDGDVYIDVLYSDFIDNGAYCDPARLAAFLPAPPEADFDVGTQSSATIPPAITGSPDDACFEREVSLYDDGSVEDYAFGIDVDDGFDVDEAGAGSIIGLLSGGTMRGNLDEGFDFDEAGRGGIDVTFVGILAEGNADDAIKLSEDGAGDVYAVVQAGEVVGNGGVGIVAEEDSLGDLSLMVLGTGTSGNDGGDLGVEAVQEGDGRGRVWVVDSELADGVETDGASIQTD